LNQRARLTTTTFRQRIAEFAAAQVSEKREELEGAVSLAELEILAEERASTDTR
jgi:hypothetical protein